MTESGQGGGPQPGAPWGPDPAYPAYPAYPGYAEQPEHPAAGQDGPGGPAGPAGPAYGYPHAQPAPAPGHVVGPGYEGPGQPHGYGYPPLPEAVTQYIPPVPADPSAPPPHAEAATQYIPPVQHGQGPGPGPTEDATQYLPPVPPPHAEAATQYLSPVPPGPAAASPPPHAEAATQYLPPVPPGPAASPPPHAEAATQFIPPVPPGPSDPGFDGLFRGDDDSAGHTQHLPPVQEPVLRPQPPRRRGPVPPPQQQQPYPKQQYQPQFAPPPAPETARRVSPVIVGAVVIGLAVVGLGVGSLLGGGKPQNNDPGAVSTASASGTGAATGGEAPVDPGRPQAVQLDKLLADSNDSRDAVIRAVEDIKNCKNLDQAASDLRDAARQRDELVTRLQELKLDQLPDHAKLSAALTDAWQSSALADNSYAAWANDVNSDKGCKDGKAANTGNATAANKASGQATKAKQQASALWNNVASKYKLTKRDKSQL